MKTVNHHAAEPHFPGVTEEAIRGEAVVVAKAGRPPVQSPAKLGFLSGQFQTPADFDRMGESEMGLMSGGRR